MGRSSGRRPNSTCATAREFHRRYRAELASGDTAAALAHLRSLAERRRLTLLTGTRNPATSNAAVVAELLAEPS